MLSCKAEAASCNGWLCYLRGQTGNLHPVLQISRMEAPRAIRVSSAVWHTSCSISKSSIKGDLAGAEPLWHAHAQVFAAERDGAIEKPDQSGGFKEREMNMFSEKSGDPRWKLVRKGTAPAFAPQNMRSVRSLPPASCARSP